MPVTVKVRLRGEGRRRIFAGGAALLLLLFAGFSAALKVELRAAGNPSPLASGTAAPPLALPTTQGSVLELSQVAAEHRLVVVVFWASWCAPCRVELHRLASLARSRPDELAVLAVSVDRDAEALDAFLRRTPLPYPVLLDSERTAAAAYGVRIIPTSVLVDGDGRIQRVLVGFKGYLEVQVEHLLASDAA